MGGIDAEDWRGDVCGQGRFDREMVGWKWCLIMGGVAFDRAGYLLYLPTFDLARL